MRLKLMSLDAKTRGMKQIIRLHRANVNKMKQIIVINRHITLKESMRTIPKTKIAKVVVPQKAEVDQEAAAEAKEAIHMEVQYQMAVEATDRMQGISSIR